MTDRLWSAEDIAEYAGYSMTQVRKIVYRPGFPTPVRVFERAHPRWIEREVRQFMEARKEAA